MTRDEIILQSPEDVLIQKNRFSLLCSGNALIIFTFWTIIRSIIQVYHILPENYHLGTVSLMTVALMVLASCSIDLVLKVFVGLSAKAEGRGKKKSSVYIVLGILLAVLTAMELITLTPSLTDERLNNSVLSVIISIAVDATVLFAELDLVVSAIRVRKIEKAAAAGSGEVE